MKLNELTCVSSNVSLTDYLKLYKYVRDNMPHPEWLGTFTEKEIIDILITVAKYGFIMMQKLQYVQCFIF